MMSHKEVWNKGLKKEENLKCKVEGDIHSTTGRIVLGYCTRHLARFRRNGNPLAGRTAKGVTEKFFKEKISLETDDCIEWEFAKVEGYGVFRNNVRVHRESLKLAKGEPPKDKPLSLHTCDNPSCFNPRHLYWGNNSENTKDMMGRKRMYGGERHHWNKLTEKQVKEIRSSNESDTAMGKKYEVNPATIWNLRNGKTWNWL